MRYAFVLLVLVLIGSCTQEQQNLISRRIQNWTGANGVLDIIGNEKVIYRFIHIDKLSTAKATSGGEVARPYRFGYGVLDQNQNYLKDENERKLYFEISDYSTNYVFYENPLDKKSAKP